MYPSFHPGGRSCPVEKGTFAHCVHMQVRGAQGIALLLPAQPDAYPSPCLPLSPSRANISCPVFHPK